MTFWWVVVSYRQGERADVLQARTWAAAKRVRGEALQLLGQGAATLVSVYDSDGECVYDSDRDAIDGRHWRMTAPAEQGRYRWVHDELQPLRREKPSPALVYAATETGDWRSSAVLDGRRSCPSCGRAGWREGQPLSQSVSTTAPRHP